MSRLRKRPASPNRPADDEIRNQEVLRATRELAAYFKGRQTERERADPATRRPLPIAGRKQPSKAAAGHPRAARPRQRILRPVAHHPAAHSPAAPDADHSRSKKDHA